MLNVVIVLKANKDSDGGVSNGMDKRQRQIARGRQSKSAVAMGWRPVRDD